MLLPSEFFAAVRNLSRIGESDELIEAPTPAQNLRIIHMRHVAVDVFESRGFANTTIEEISTRAGVSSRTFFRYFPSKEAVLFSDHATHVGALERDLRLGPVGIPTASSSLSRILLELAQDQDFLTRRADLVRTSNELHDQEVLWFEEYKRRIGAFLSSDSRLADTAPMMIAAALIAAFRGSIDAIAASGGSPPSSAQFHESVRMLMDWAGPASSRETRSATVVVTTALTPAEIANLLERARD